jgi:hypothetical protein
VHQERCWAAAAVVQFVVFKIDQTHSCRTFKNVRMKSGPLIETEALKVLCPTCGAGPKVKCELVIGGPRRQSHLDRRLIASDSLLAKGKRPHP